MTDETLAWGLCPAAAEDLEKAEGALPVERSSDMVIEAMGVAGGGVGGRGE